MKQADVIHRINEAIKSRAQRGERIGQAAYNEFHKINSTSANAISGSKADPFYVDGHMQNFWTFIGLLYPE